MRYEKAAAEIILFDNSDVITASGETYFCMEGYDRPGSGCSDGTNADYSGNW